MPSLTPFKDDLPILEVVHPEQDAHNVHNLSIAVRPKLVYLHSELPAPASVWSYERVVGHVAYAGSGHTFLGPSIEVRRGTPVTVAWKNDVPGGATLPYEVIKTNATPTDPVPQNLPGRASAIPFEQDKVRNQAHNLHASLVTHLHGGRTQADYDGWPDNTILPGQVAHYTYHNDQAATMLWYHDHAMHVTRLNVYAGLAGVWLVRDAEEDELHLPNRNYEILLVIQDRNLDTDEAGDFTGALLHKVEVNGGEGPAEFFGPYTLVNGKIWPKCSVEARLYRLRLLNGSNARTYRLLFLDEAGSNLNASIWQIGCDQGLMEKKTPLPENGLILMPAERADLLLDFSAYAGSVYLWNTADAPFGNEASNRPSATDVTAELLNLRADPHAAATAVAPENADRRRIFPQVMRFDVGAVSTQPPAVVPPDPLRSARPQPILNANTPVRIMGLVEEPAPDPTVADATTMLVFWEFVSTSQEPAPAGADVVTFTYWHPGKGVCETQEYWKAAEEFYDKINWFIHLDATEVWYIVNLSGDSHPIHVHLGDFQVSQAYAYTWNDKDPLATPFDASASTLTKVEATALLNLDPNTAGPKDTVRVDPGQMVGITMTFSPYPGRYMYHCHILEHEDHDMMRPIVIVPKWVPHHNH